MKTPLFPTPQLTRAQKKVLGKIRQEVQGRDPSLWENAFSLRCKYSTLEALQKLGLVTIKPKHHSIYDPEVDYGVSKTIKNP